MTGICWDFSICWIFLTPYKYSSFLMRKTFFLFHQKRLFPFSLLIDGWHKFVSMKSSS